MMKPNLTADISENDTNNCFDNMDLAIWKALYQRTESLNDRFRLSDEQFYNIFQITPNFFLYEFGDKVKSQIAKYHDNMNVYASHLAIWEFAQCLLSLIFSPTHTNSSINEFAKLYSYLNIINVNRSNLMNKWHYRNKLFQSFLFTAPYSWEFSRATKLAKNCIIYNGENIEGTLSEFFNIKGQGEADHCAMLDSMNRILKTTYSYMVGEKLFMPFRPQKDVFSYYFYHPFDFIELYRNHKTRFYGYMDESVAGKTSFMKKAFVYNYSLFIISNPTVIMSELERFSSNKDKILEVLFLSNSTLPNSAIREIKFGKIKSEKDTAYNIRINLPNG